MLLCFFLQAEDGIRDLVRSRGLGNVYKRQVVSNAVPAKWYYTIVRSVMIKGTGFQAVWKETLILAGMLFFFLGLAIKNFKIRLA